jgi:hypothetical protein
MKPRFVVILSKSEESLDHEFGSVQQNDQRCFASLNMTETVSMKA